MSTNDPPPSPREVLRTRMAEVLEIVRPCREALDAKGYRAMVTARDEAGRITLVIDVLTVPGL